MTVNKLSSQKISKENTAYIASLTAFCFSFSKWGTDDYIIKLFLALLVLFFCILVIKNIIDKKRY